jgi:cyclophilin family peptidyl-prolyl cis-trans isomerase
MHAMTEMKCAFALLSLVLGLATGCASREGSPDDQTIFSGGGVEVETSMGIFEIQLFIEESPITSANFLAYVDEGFYDGEDGLGATVFHRVISGFVAQGGGLTAGGENKVTHAAILNEAGESGLLNVRGTLAMARTSQPHSATSQFFVNLTDNDFLDPDESTDGYAVFAEVTAGMDVVDAIGEVATDAADGPLEPITIEQIARVE